jgi:hypothetical protein
MKRYASIVRHKTSYYSFYLPVQLGMGLVRKSVKVLCTLRYSSIGNIFGFRQAFVTLSFTDRCEFNLRCTRTVENCK